ncbi:hypothetical protein GCM10020256_66870 [Streptomyces thermocoprophilus]
MPEKGRPEGADVRAEFAAFRNVQVWLAMAMTVFGYGGVFAAITYITPMMTDVAGYSAGAVTWLLVLFGGGMFAGNLIGGRFADRALMPMLFGSLGALSLALLLFTATAHDKVLAAITLTLIGALGFATVPPLQKWVLDQASAAPHPGLGRQHRRLQPRQRAGRMARRHRHRRGARLHLPELGGLPALRFRAAAVAGRRRTAPPPRQRRPRGGRLPGPPEAAPVTAGH